MDLIDVLLPPCVASETVAAGVLVAEVMLAIDAILDDYCSSRHCHTSSVLPRGKQDARLWWEL